MSRYNICRKKQYKKEIKYKKEKNRNTPQIKKNNEKNIIQYYFTEKKGTKDIFNVKISKNTIQRVFSVLRENFGEERVNDYKVYKDGDLELTVYQEGSNFCNLVTEKRIKDEAIHESILVCHLNLKKVHNDKFPCKFKYEEVLDVIDVFFEINESNSRNKENYIKIIMRCKYDNCPNLNTIKKIHEIGMKQNVSDCDKFWIEFILEASPLSNPKKVHELINLIYELI